MRRTLGDNHMPSGTAPTKCDRSIPERHVRSKSQQASGTFYQQVTSKPFLYATSRNRVAVENDETQRVRWQLQDTIFAVVHASNMLCSDIHGIAMLLLEEITID
jgi:hypothetical protein